ncbi:MAG TPA: family 16 glycoside hydrolase [Tepidisphaeraceae bacterium]|nr:family 16 glycoside hydrolase [Tepidisphaeraceae bacterium]
MRHSSLRFLLLACLLALPTARAEENDDGFIPLFNNRDLSGWVNVNCAPSTWTVRDNMIVCTGIPTGVLHTTKQYENFILEADWMHLKTGGNSGIFVWSGALPICGEPFTKAVECQVLDGNHGDVFAIQGATFVPDRAHPKGWMRCLPSESRNHPAGQWNHYRIECQAGRVQLAVNGKVVAGGSKTIPRKGYIVLESEGSDIYFKNIRVKESPSSNVPDAEVAELDRGFKSLYTGVDLVGWKLDDGQQGHWTAKDWNLNCDGKVEGEKKNLVSENSYADFELIMDWKTPAKPAPQQVPLILGGVTPAAKITKPPGQWNRALITIEGTKTKISVNDQPAIDGPDLPAKESPIILLHRAEGIQFANLYLRPLK